ncbi:MAG: hypothetical protein R3C11_24495 [Planctomycetaceae bacterium]
MNFTTWLTSRLRAKKNDSRKHRSCFSLHSNQVGWSQLERLEDRTLLSNTGFAFNVGGDGTDSIYDMVVDPQGNSYSIGRYQNTVDFDPGAGVIEHTNTSGNGIFILKTDPNGNVVWAKDIAGTGSVSSYSLAIAIDAANNVYASGYFTGVRDFDPGPGVHNLDAGSANDGFLLKLNNAGNFIWATNLASDTGYVQISDLGVDSAGNVYITGAFSGTVDFNPGPGTAELTKTTTTNLFVAKYNSTGAFSWVKQLHGDSDSFTPDMAVSGTGDVFLTVQYKGTMEIDPGWVCLK